MHDHNGHTHSHDVQSLEEVIATLRFMLKHNEHHADELHSLVHELRHHGLSGQADEVERGILDYKNGNVRLKKALEEIGV